MRPQINDVLPLSQLPPGSRVLDLGCGSGTIAYTGFPQLRFFGVDQFAHTDSRQWPANAFLTLADGERLPWPEGCFDAAICNFVFEHLIDPGAALRELDRVIRPDGLLYISIPRANSMEDRLFRFTMKGGGHLQRYTLDKFLRLVYRESGFKLEGLAPSPGGFTWLQDVPHADFLRGLLFRSFRLWQLATGNNPLAASFFLLLFRLGKNRGFKHIHPVCSHCGNSISSAPSGGAFWKCPDCGFKNILVGP